MYITEKLKCSYAEHSETIYMKLLQMPTTQKMVAFVLIQQAEYTQWAYHEADVNFHFAAKSQTVSKQLDYMGLLMNAYIEQRKRN